MAQHLEQQSQPGNATQQAQEAAAQPEVVALNNRMELRRSAQSRRRIAATLNCSLTREHTAVEEYIYRRSYTPLAIKQLQTRNGMIGIVQTQEWGGAGGTQPPLNCLTHLGAALHCKDQAAQVEQEQRECSCP